MPSRPVIVSGLEKRVVVASLKLQTGFEDFGGNVDDRRSEVCNEPWNASVTTNATVRHKPAVTSCEIGYGRVDAVIEQMSLAVFVCAKEYHSAWE
jgi:hypothetical protein